MLKAGLQRSGAAMLAAFALGAGAVAWVALGGVAGHPLALAMTLAIGAVYLAGAAELWRFRGETQALQSSLADAAAPAAFDALPPALRSAVRRRLDGERAGLPGPALAPALVGLLVLLGMLGTFLGLVVTLDGTVLALERTSDLAAMRAALAAPVKGLGLAFGTSVAGVAASAMLGLMLALARRDRAAAARALDHALATTLRAHTHEGRRGEQLERIAQGLQAQAALLPGVVEQVQALITRLDERDTAAQQRAIDGQAAWQRETQAQFGALASSVRQSLHDSLADAARVAGATLQPVAESTMAGIARESAAMQAQLLTATRAQLDALGQALQAHAERLDERTASAQAGLLRDAAAQAAATQQAWAESLAARTEALQRQLAAQSRDTLAEVARLTETAADAPRAAAAVITQLREQLSASLQRDQALMDERGRLAEALTTLLDDARRGAQAQQQAVQSLVDGAQALLQRTGESLGREWQAAAQQQAEAATRLAGGAVEVASLGEALAATVQQFGATGAALADRLATIESALDGAATRHDEQLAYYVAQARELIELSASAQQPLLEAVQKLAAPVRTAAEADA